MLVALNPYKTLQHEGKSIYSDEFTRLYRDAESSELPPHIFSTAQEAYAALLRTGENQTIIVTGESGAGKTVASSHILSFLVAASAVRSPGSDKAASAHVREALLHSNPVLEAFGNAQTLRNNNSSRFGRYMSLAFGLDGGVKGGTVMNYLLEKARVTNQSAGERNFHVFYQVLAGAQADSELRTALALPDGAQSKYLANGVTKVPGIDDAADFKEVCTALGVLGVPKAEQLPIWQLLMGLLWLSAIEFKQDGDTTAVQAGAALDNAAACLGVSTADLSRVLTTRHFSATGGPAAGAAAAAGGHARRGSVYKVQFDEAQALDTRDSMARAAYDKLFQWLVQRVNASISDSGTTDHHADRVQCGILDIYGFEILEHNSLEQLNINYVNEKLQALFIALTLKSEQAEYEAEGIPWTRIDYFDNQAVCSAIEGRTGLLALLDDACMQKDAKDASFLNTAATRLKDSPAFTQPRVAALDSFIVRHYAGDVTYEVQNFIEKNRDTLYNDIQQLLAGSSTSLVSALFEDKRTEAEKRKRPPTISTQFKAQVAALMDTLYAAQPHYVRCVKPNARKAPCAVDDDLLDAQVRYLGIEEQVRVRRAGYVYRATYPRFLHRFKCLSSKTWPSFPAVKEATFGFTPAEEITGVPGARTARMTGIDRTPKEIGADSPLLPAYSSAVEALMHDAMAVRVAKRPGQPPSGLRAGEDFAMGKTKIFIRAPATMFALEDARTKALAKVATAVAAQWRAFIHAKRFQAMRKSSTLLAAEARRRIAQRKFAEAKQGIVRVQSFARGALVRARPETHELRLRLGMINFHGKARRRASLAWSNGGDALGLNGNAKWRSHALAAKAKVNPSGTPIDPTVLFSDWCLKMNRKGQWQRRGIAVTASHLLHIGEDGCTPARATVLTEVSDVSFSPYTDCYIVVFCQAQDYFLLMQRKVEFTSVLSSAARRAGGCTLASALTSTQFMNKAGGQRGAGGKDTFTVAWQQVPVGDPSLAAQADPARKPEAWEKLVAPDAKSGDCGGPAGAWTEQPRPWHELVGHAVTVHVPMPAPLRLADVLSAAELAEVERRGLRPGGRASAR